MLSLAAVSVGKVRARDESVYAVEVVATRENQKKFDLVQTLRSVERGAFRSFHDCDDPASPMVVYGREQGLRLFPLIPQSANDCAYGIHVEIAWYYTLHGQYKD